MKHVYTLYLLALSLCLSSQSFTNGSVFNYSVGDTIATSVAQYTDSYNSAGPPTFTYRVFTNKYYSGGMDTVFYQAHDVYVAYPQIPPYYPPTVSSANTSFFVTNLGASAINFILPGIQSCQTTIDTSYINSCGLNEHLKYAMTGFGCFEPPNIQYQIVEGIGVFQDTRSLNGFPFPGGTRSELMWFRKGNKRCGVANAIPDGIKEWAERTETLIVYPNPFDGQFTFESTEKGILSLQNLLGEEIYKVEILSGKNSFDLTGYVSGVYVAKCVAGNKTYTGKLIKR